MKRVGRRKKNEAKAYVAFAATGPHRLEGGSRKGRKSAGKGFISANEVWQSNRADQNGIGKGAKVKGGLTLNRWITPNKRK